MIIIYNRGEVVVKKKSSGGVVGECVNPSPIVCVVVGGVVYYIVLYCSFVQVCYCEIFTIK